MIRGTTTTPPREPEEVVVEDVTSEAWPPFAPEIVHMVLRRIVGRVVPEGVPEVVRTHVVAGLIRKEQELVIEPDARSIGLAIFAAAPAGDLALTVAIHDARAKCTLTPRLKAYLVRGGIWSHRTTLCIRGTSWCDLQVWSLRVR